MNAVSRTIIWRRLALCLILGLAPCGAFAQPANTPVAAATVDPNVAGVIDLVEGQVNVLDTNRKRRTVKVGDKLFEGDSVVTGKTGELLAELVDGGVLVIRPDTAMNIIKYQANGAATDTSIFGLLKGSFRSITGWIGKTTPANYQIRTPTATVGVRGTDHEPLVIPAGAASGDPGTYDRVNIGTSTITGSTGAVDVTPGRAGFFAQHGRDRPRVLDQGAAAVSRYAQRKPPGRPPRARACRTRATPHPAPASDSGARQAARGAPAAIESGPTPKRKARSGAGKTARTRRAA